MVHWHSTLTRHLPQTAVLEVSATLSMLRSKVAPEKADDTFNYVIEGSGLKCLSNPRPVEMAVFFICFLPPREAVDISIVITVEVNYRNIILIPVPHAIPQPLVLCRREKAVRIVTVKL